MKTAELTTVERVYNGFPVTFKIGNSDLMVNANQMAAVYKKRPPDFLRTKPTKDYIKALSQITHISVNELVFTKQKQGTWIHESLAMEFARWLNPEFGIWCNVKIKELLTAGKAELSEDEKRLLTGKIDQMEMKVKELEARTTIAPEWYTITGYAVLRGFRHIHTDIAKSIGKIAVKLCEKEGIKPGSAFHPVWARVNTYPLDILDKAYRKWEKIPKF